MKEFFKNLWTRESAFRGALLAIGGICITLPHPWANAVGIVCLALGGGITAGTPEAQVRELLMRTTERRKDGGGKENSGQ